MTPLDAPLCWWCWNGSGGLSVATVRFDGHFACAMHACVEWNDEPAMVFEQLEFVAGLA